MREWTGPYLRDAGQPLSHFALPFIPQAEVSTRNEVVESPDIVDVFPGIDPQLKNETGRYVQVSIQRFPTARGVTLG